MEMVDTVSTKGTLVEMMDTNGVVVVIVLIAPWREWLKYIVTGG